MNKLVVTVVVSTLLTLGIWMFQKHGTASPLPSSTLTQDELKSEAPLELSEGALPVEMVAELDHDLLPEASGLAVSGLDPQRLWLLNDSGSRSELVALDLESNSFTRVNILDTANRDWEDIESFSYRGTPWIMIADVGDNRARRGQVTLYFLPEPKGKERRASVSTTVSLSYPDGSRDVESVAIDPVTNTLYLLSKRDEYPRLYALTLPELIEGREYTLQPQLLGEVRSIPPPTSDELRKFPKYGKYRSQPTGMSHMPDGSAIALLTYGGTFVAPLGSDRDWLTALNQSLCMVSRPELEQAESIAADMQGRLYISSEGREAPVIRVTPDKACRLARE